MNTASKLFIKKNFAKFIKNEINEEQYSNNLENIDFSYFNYKNLYYSVKSGNTLIEKLNLRNVSKDIFQLLEISLNNVLAPSETKNQIFEILKKLSISEVLYISAYLAINEEKIIYEFSELKKLSFLIETIFNYINLNYSKDILEILNNESRHEIISFIYTAFLSLSQLDEFLTKEYKFLNKWIDLLMNSLEINFQENERSYNLFLEFYAPYSLKLDSLETSILFLKCSIENIKPNFDLYNFLVDMNIKTISKLENYVNFIYLFATNLECAKMMDR